MPQAALIADQAGIYVFVVEDGKAAVRRVKIGGESGPALKRTADVGNGWFGFNVGPDDAGPLSDKLRAMLKANRRDARDVEIIVSPYTKKIVPDDLKKYAAAGVNELVIIASPPEDEAQISGWIEKIAREWVEPAGKIG